MKTSSMKGPHILQSPVILSEARVAPSAPLAQSKDPISACTFPKPRKEFSRKRLSSRIALCALALLLLSSLSFAAQTLTGTVKNSTTGKPAVGDDAVLLKLAEGMEEAGRTTPTAKAHSTFAAATPQ